MTEIIMPDKQYATDMEVANIADRETAEEFHRIIEAEFDTTHDSKETYDEPFLMRRMVLKDVVAFDNRHMQPSTNRQVTWSPTDDGREKVDAVTYGDND